eukprot:TRINITY_DN1036_c0_g1_i1.p1 TRINITY_DN1036_c0_g1~~TRINITY_DN1036_c0_g1_i1.p1  ORF type:complete len:375 (+),score=158.22 TRINITY_DN1036_c0_g1_i1:58-1182(+)
MSRVRTESMVMRLSKKPLTEGFDLWDQDYLLGALRLFQCKLESSPPFEVAPCLESIATILGLIEEDEDAVEHFHLAAEKYNLIQKKHLGALMTAMATEIQKGEDAAIAVIDASIAGGDESKDKQKSQLGRLYSYRAELKRTMEKVDEGVADAQKALSLRPGRLADGDMMHAAHHTLGQLFQTQGKLDEAAEQFKAALAARPLFFPAAEAMIGLLKSQGDLNGALEYIDTAHKLHPKASLIREKAFTLSDLGSDEDGLRVCDEAIANPPHEETEALTGNCSSAGTLYKAKAAILADSSRLQEAKDMLDKALEQDPDDPEATQMIADIHTTLSRGYLDQHNIPKYLDALVNMVIEAKPADPLSFVINVIENNKVTV